MPLKDLLTPGSASFAGGARYFLSCQKVTQKRLSPKGSLIFRLKSPVCLRFNVTPGALQLRGPALVYSGWHG
jgi:hypothetical protein